MRRSCKKTQRRMVYDAGRQTQPYYYSAKDHQDRVCPPARHNKNYIYILTDNSRPEKKETLTFSRTLAMLIALEFG